MSIAIAVMSKTAGLSPVKTRLAADIGDAAATLLHRLAADATASVVMRAIGGHSGHAATAYWAVAETDVQADADWIERQSAGFHLVHQSPGQLGERMGRLHSTLLNRHVGVILVGIDSPQMEPGQLLQALDWLQSDAPRLALGPAEDGGFWLFGANREIPLPDWSRVEYSTAHTGAQFAAVIAARGELLTLPMLCDADRLADLPRLCSGLKVLPEPTPAQSALLRWLAERAA